jgi:hypothetical protein
MNALPARDRFAAPFVQAAVTNLFVSAFNPPALPLAGPATDFVPAGGANPRDVDGLFSSIAGIHLARFPDGIRLDTKNKSRR